MVGLASSEGGGENPSSIYFRGTNITGNRVLDQNYGGGVALMNNNAGGIISFEDCLIEDNHADSANTDEPGTPDYNGGGVVYVNINENASPYGSGVQVLRRDL